jgi:hypothetical protein
MNKEKLTKEDLLDKLNHIIWDEQIIDSVVKSDYPGRFEQQFGAIQFASICLNDFGIDRHGKKELVKFLESWGFVATKCGCIVNMSDSYFVNLSLKLGINVAYELDYKNVCEEDDLDDLESFDEITRITFCPLYKNREKIEKFISDFWDFEHLKSIKDDTRDFYMIAQNNQGLYKKRTKFKNIAIKDDRYDLYYGEKFPKEKIFNFVKEDNGNLMILHGDPGSGKSNLIKNLITESKYDVIYIPPGMVSTISTPSFVPFMLQNKKSILLIEDAEEVLSTERNSGTQNILGITDGFLKDSLQIKVIATMNCDIGKIDQALLRKGRLYYEHHFKALTENEVRKLVDYLGLKITADKPMTLAEIFNREDNSDEDNFEERRIGFV